MSVNRKIGYSGDESNQTQGPSDIPLILMNRSKYTPNFNCPPEDDPPWSLSNAKWDGELTRIRSSNREVLKRPGLDPWPIVDVIFNLSRIESIAAVRTVLRPDICTRILYSVSMNGFLLISFIRNPFPFQIMFTGLHLHVPIPKTRSRKEILGRKVPGARVEDPRLSRFT